MKRLYDETGADRYAVRAVYMEAALPAAKRPLGGFRRRTPVVHAGLARRTANTVAADLFRSAGRGGAAYVQLAGCAEGAPGFGDTALGGDRATETVGAASHMQRSARVGLCVLSRSLQPQRAENARGKYSGRKPERLTPRCGLCQDSGNVVK
jgi:hypothetical protein